MSLMMDDVKYFIAVSETLNITRASEIIGISQPALSYAIKRLENERYSREFNSCSKIKKKGDSQYELRK